MPRLRVRGILFGPPGSGKGTQGALLAEQFGVAYVGVGDLVRAEVAEGGRLGDLVRDYVDHGVLAPDELVNAILASRLKKLDLGQGFVLDGYPRNVEQAQWLDRTLKPNLAIALRLPDDAAVARLRGRRMCRGCGAVWHAGLLPKPWDADCPCCEGMLETRSDDAEEPVRRRLRAYHFMTEPLASFYRQKGILLTVDAGPSIADVNANLVKKMLKLGFIS